MRRTTDLNTETNEQFRFFKRFSREGLLVSLCLTVTVISGLALFQSWIALYSATQAHAMVDYELHATRDEIKILKNQMRLTDVYLQKNHVKMDALNINPVPLPERK